MSDSKIPQNTPEEKKTMYGLFSGKGYVVLIIILVGAVGATTLWTAENPYHKPRHLRIIWKETPQTNAVVSWSTWLSTKDNIVYFDTQSQGGIVKDYSTNTASTSDGQYEGAPRGFSFHHVRLEKLKPNTTYWFVVSSSGVASKEYIFKTAPDKDTDIKIIYGGDSREDRKARSHVNKMIGEFVKKDKAIIALAHGGDYINSGTNFEQWKHWLIDYQHAHTAGERILPIIPARGNHEKTGELYDQIFDSPGGGIGKNYFALKLTPEVVFLTLNTEVANFKDQVPFINRTLRENQKVRWKAVQYHRPAYPAKKSPSPAKDEWVPLFDKWKVDVVCEADGHVLKRTVPIKNDKKDPQGVVYIGEGGLGVFQRRPNDGLWYLAPPGIKGRGHHIHILSFSEEGLNIKAVLLQGRRQVDDYTISPKR